MVSNTGKEKNHTSESRNNISIERMCHVCVAVATLDVHLKNIPTAHEQDGNQPRLYCRCNKSFNKNSTNLKKKNIYRVNEVNSHVSKLQNENQQLRHKLRNIMKTSKTLMLEINDLKRQLAKAGMKLHISG